MSTSHLSVLRIASACCSLQDSTRGCNNVHRMLAVLAPVDTHNNTRSLSSHVASSIVALSAKPVQR